MFAEIIGVLSQSHSKQIQKIFLDHLTEYRKELSNNPVTVRSIISLLMGMKFFRVNVRNSNLKKLSFWKLLDQSSVRIWNGNWVSQRAWVVFFGNWLKAEGFETCIGRTAGWNSFTNGGGIFIFRKWRIYFSWNILANQNWSQYPSTDLFCGQTIRTHLWFS